MVSDAASSSATARGSRSRDGMGMILSEGGLGGDPAPKRRGGLPQRTTPWRARASSISASS